MRPLVSNLSNRQRSVRKIISMFPTHKVFVDAVLGSGSVLLGKRPSEREVVSDVTDFSFMYKFLKNASDETVRKLEGMDWDKSERLYKKLKNKKPTTDLDRFRQFVYTNCWAIDEQYERYKGEVFVDTTMFELVRQRLKDVDVYTEKYSDVIKKNDSVDTFTFIDLTDVKSFSDERAATALLETLRGIKGKFLAIVQSKDSYVEKFKEFEQNRLLRYRGRDSLELDILGTPTYELVLTNYPLRYNDEYFPEGAIKSCETLTRYVSYAESDTRNFVLRVPRKLFYEVERVVRDNVKKPLDFSDFSDIKMLSDTELSDALETLSIFDVDKDFHLFSIYNDTNAKTKAIDTLLRESLSRSVCFVTSNREVFNSLKTKVTAGLYVPQKYVSLINNGSVSAIIKARNYEGMVGKPLWLCDDKRVYGVIKLSSHVKIGSLTEFNAVADKHKMGDAERVSMFGKDRTEFYMYDISVVTKLPVPVAYVWRSGTQGFVKNVQFVPTENKGGDGKI